MASLRDVAEHAGVSLATASRVVSGLDNVPGRFQVVSTEPQHTLVALLGEAERRGAELEELSVQKPSLDDVFLAVTGREFRE